MAIATHGLLTLLHEAISGSPEVTLRGIMEVVDFGAVEHHLERLQELDALLQQLRLELRPHISTGGPDELRVLVYSNGNAPFGERLLALLELGEQVDVEFKSTAFVALRLRRDEGRAITDCESEGVLLAVLKTICGFLNKDGGEIYVGVEPNGALCGLGFDYELLPSNARDFDGWANRLQDKIRSRFYEAPRVMNYIEFAHELIGEAAVCRIKVRPRGRLSFVKDSAGLYRCYVRQNVRTEEIRIEELPDLIESRSQ